jgi:lipopolysaccharide/colanic/teichoic acid biosynthesis glycosyltransferase
MFDNVFIDKVTCQFPNLNFNEIVRIDKPNNVQIGEGEKYGIFIHEPLLNNLLDINLVLGQIYNAIEEDRYLIIKYKPQPIATIKNLKSISNFILKRVIPKIPYLNYLYNPIFNRENKSLSKAEVWGRLMYCGFDVQYEEVISNTAYVLCKKIKIEKWNKNPSYYPIIKLIRVGHNGQFINIYKVRSMYPYSEFIQKKVYEMNSLSESGKFQNDFRITEYGKIVRKFWIDELPQIINLIKHDIKLVGIRAMSEHYFSLYPEEYKTLYKKVRPGFLSPLYENTTFECIVSTEKKYLEEYLKHPLKTDIKYFFRITLDILKGKRSA